MSFYNLSPNMNLPVPQVGLDPGPDYAANLNNSLTIIDGHNHTPGYGVPIPVAGLNINSDFPLNSNNLASVRSVRLISNSSVLSGSLDINCLNDVNGDLYFNDGSGNKIQITKAGGINATSSGISNGTASASFVGGVLVVNAATNTPANIQGASVLIGNNTAGSNFVELSAPNALSSNYTVTFPSAPPTSVSPVLMDNSGNLSASPSQFTAFMPTGAVIPFAVSTPPSGYLNCDGSSYSTTTYANLFAVIGYTFGGSGTSFNVPNMQGSVPIGPGGTINASIGGVGGEATHTLTTNELPAHSHAASSGINFVGYPNGLGSTLAVGTAAPVAFSEFASTQNTGSNFAHNNVQPYLCLNYIIKT